MGSSQGERSRLSWKTNPSAGQLDADSLVKTIEMDFFFNYLFLFGCSWSSLLRRLSLASVSRGYSLLRRMSFSLQ